MKCGLNCSYLLVASFVLGGCAGSDLIDLDTDVLSDSMAVGVLCPAFGPGIMFGGSDPMHIDSIVAPQRRLVLMGGGPEVDLSSAFFVDGAGGGNIVVLRTSGSVSSYSAYFQNDLEVESSPASVLTLSTSPPEAAQDAGVLCHVDRAEAIWLAGGDQWDYLGVWPSSLKMKLADATDSGVVFGGTSAGAVSLGEAAFDARNGTITSEQALQNPNDSRVSISYPEFSQPELDGMIVDSHFMDRDREGRLIVFVARFLHDRSLDRAIGIGLDEQAALQIEPGRYTVVSNAGASVWIYRVLAPTSMPEGEGLSLHQVERIQLKNGDSGEWPPLWVGVPVDTLRVTNGVIVGPPN